MVSTRIGCSKGMTRAATVASFAFVLSACGGRQEDRTPADEVRAAPTALPDATSCDAPSAYELRPIQDFEDDKVGYFWLSNDVCDSCRGIQDAMGPLANQLAAIRKDGDEPPAELEEQYAALQEQADECAERCQAVQEPDYSSGDLNTCEVTSDTGKAEPHCGSTRAIHVVAGPFTDWGGVVGTSFETRANALEWDGITFWARRGNTPGHDGRTVFVAITEKHTTETASKALANYQCGCTEGPDCDQEEEACDRFGVAVELTPEWRYWVIPFAQMKQRGYGAVAECMDLAELIGVSVYYEKGSWDLWLDDLSFYRAKKASDRSECIRCCGAESTTD